MSQPNQYTRELLTEAAALCSDIDEVIAFFGTARYERLGRYLMSRFSHYDIDVSHFSPLGRRPRPDTTDLRQAVAESVSIAETLRRLGRPDNGGQRALLRRWTAEDGAHQRGRPSPTPVRTAKDVLVKHSGVRRTQASVLRRALHEIGGGRAVRRVPYRLSLARKAHDPGGRPHQRRLERRPAREPSAALSQLPCHHQHLVPRWQGRKAGQPSA